MLSETTFRRIIYSLVFIIIAIPVLIPLNLPVTVTKEVRGVYDEIDKLPSGSTILVAFDYEPSSSAELDPMVTAVLRHCFQKNIKVIGMGIWISSGAGIAENLLTKIGKEYSKVKGIDYVNLGYKTGDNAVVLGLNDNIRNTFPKDYTGVDVDKYEILKNINSLKQIPYMVCIHDDGSVFTWTTYAFERIGIKIGTGCTAVMATGNYPALQSKQITGIIGGLKGASEYEKLMKYRGNASAGMDSQSVIHLFIILLIVLGNIVYFTKLRKKNN